MPSLKALAVTAVIVLAVIYADKKFLHVVTPGPDGKSIL